MLMKIHDRQGHLVRAADLPSDAGTALAAQLLDGPALARAGHCQPNQPAQLERQWLVRQTSNGEIGHGEQ
jgi:hypothetical protein